MAVATTLVEALTGKTRLWRVFWLGFIPLVFLLTAISYAVVFFAIGMPPWKFGLVMSVLGVFSLLLLFVAWTAIWRCAWNARFRFWGYVARLFVVVYFVWYGRKVLVTLYLTITL